ncbi:trk system potassium uptake protein TrkH [Ruminococcaceae bacterium KH2T8]|nr:trk system potassium uptake protein TrkH [Ruminococcaceae bacterium KH2T8]
MERLGDFVTGRKQVYEESRIRLSPAYVVPLSFLFVIILGTILLMLPFASASGEMTDPVTALFTATTSTCVTGLVVEDTYAYWSLAGQIIILILIQLGGLGIISFTSMVLLASHKKFSLQDRKLLVDAMNLDMGHGLLSFLVKVFKWTFIVEGFGACLYSIEFIPRYGVVKGIWYSVFTAISAFCNAGIDVLGPDSLISFNKDSGVLFITMFLIVMGGLGYVVWFDVSRVIKIGIRNRYSPLQAIKRLGVHTKLVLALTFILIAVGMLIVFPSEFNNPGTMADMGLKDKIVNSLFQSVTFRTAGFAAVPQQELSSVSVLIGYVLMLIGGSPIGTAGGVKTVTFFIVVINVVVFMRGQKEAIVFKSRITEELMRKAAAILTVSIAVAFTGTLFILLTNNVNMEDSLFEVISAVATVGLSRAVTPTLNVFGRIVIICVMYLGRIGPISLVLFFAGKKSGKDRIEYAEGKFYVG